jgi:hypothetical protein
MTAPGTRTLRLVLAAMCLEGGAAAADPARWSDGTVPWCYDAGAAPPAFADEARVRAIIHEAQAAWSAAANLQWMEVDPATCATEDGRRVRIAWVASVGGPSGHTRTWVEWTSTEPEHLAYANIRLAIDDLTDPRPKPPLDDRAWWRLRAVLEHELGHAIGIEHVDDPGAVMGQVTSEWTGLSAPDIREAVLRYGASGRPAELAPLVRLPGKPVVQALRLVFARGSRRFALDLDDTAYAAMELPRGARRIAVTVVDSERRVRFTGTFSLPDAGVASCERAKCLANVYLEPAAAVSSLGPAGHAVVRVDGIVQAVLELPGLRASGGVVPLQAGAGSPVQ